MGLTIEKCIEGWTNSLKQLKIKADIVFFGDSLTYYGDFASVFPDKVICNLGLRGDSIQGMTDRVVQVKMLGPKKVFLMAGINDVEKYSQDEFEAEYDSLIHQLTSQVPKATLVIQSMLPVNSIEYSIRCRNEQIISFNRIIERLSLKKTIEYLDLFSTYQKDGQLPAEMTIDGIHLKKESYMPWYEYLINGSLI